MKPTIAVLGTGLMGGPMARNLLGAGFPVQAWNRTPAKAEALVSDGATCCQSPAEAVTGADFVITMLSDGVATGAMTRDADVMAALARGAVWLDMSSTKPEEARAQQDHLASLGVDHLDAPVSGGTRGAEAGSLAIMVGGDAAAFECAVPVFEAMGRPVHVGPAGAGQLSKLANQAIVAITIGAVAEAMLLLEKGGANPAAVRDALKGGFADSTILQQHGARMTERNFAPGGLSKIQLKDLDNLLGEAASLSLALPTSQHIRDRFAHFCEEMDGAEKDHSGLYLELCARNNLKVE
ncbi:NAD(P)-dependent oxidoreductase [Sedimentitalea todarodis]|uniref:NAD(P)-dependent oxidoreductase n=1 Tax=Sedimentitalea todarodis TaxID=1631240 RepID=A0ABU3VHH6_9RHOB|nr:NAD(P)-dependent oxidoreductase [Sedimentitalea todarodis]MDU9005647.1 NAD(P)-dependent oxidoreductase [Sedimentitalea todarodis]